MAALPLLAAVVIFVVILGPFSYSSVCDKCGAVRRTTEWQLPMTHVTILSYSAASDSPLSRVLLTNGLVKAHSHQWLFAHGGGNGVRCALGQGHHILPAAQSEEIAALVLTLHKQGQKSFRDRVLEGIFDPDVSHLFWGLRFGAPTNATSAIEVEKWIAQHSQYLDEMVPEYKKR